MEQYMNNNDVINSGMQVQCFNFNYGSLSSLNGVQSEVVKSMDKLPLSVQAKILIKVYELTEKYLTKH